MKTEFLPGNCVELLESGSAYFPALRGAIEHARRDVYLETYIFEDDRTGRAIAESLCAAARRGVKVRVLVDGFGGGEFPRTLLPVLTASGVEVLIYRPEVARLRLRRHRLRRLHRKVAVIDGTVAFVGGINIVDDCNGAHVSSPRFDYAVRLAGPVLAPIYGSCRQLWGLVSWASFKRRYRSKDAAEVAAGPCGGVRVAFLVRDNLRHRRDIEDAYLEAIASARDEIVLANAYFLPGRRFRRAIRQAARRGVRVVVLLQGRVEYVLQHYASQALYGSLLAAGVRLFEYQPSFLHAKVAVVDSRWATVGSSNIDPFSLLMAREANVVVADAGFALELRASLDRAIREAATELRPEAWKRQSLAHRFVRWLAYGIVRAMIGLAGYGRQHEPELSVEGSRAQVDTADTRSS